jgi:hypothetical protein
MANKIPQEVIQAFTGYTPGLPKHSPGKTTAEPIGNGLINHTYKINCELQCNFLLQKINTRVFPRPEDVQANCDYLCQYAEFEFTGLRLPYIKEFAEGKSLYKDQNGGYWRAFEFIEDGVTNTVPSTPAQANATAKAFAKFTSAFGDMNAGNLKETIPGFHNLSLRYRQFEEALEGELYERMPKALPVADELKQREKFKFFYEEMIGSEEFPRRVVHHDAKISNVLFSKTTGKVICPVDLDTTMPGYFFSDPGDLIRSMACSADENSVLFEKLSIRKAYYEAITEGYLSVMGKWLTEAEKKHFHYSGLLIVYMQALRFLTDYLNGDTYYRTEYAEQNFDRALNQLTLLKRLEAFLKKYYNLKT